MKNNVDEGYTVLYWNFANARENVFYSKDLVNFEILVHKVVQYSTYM